MIYILGINHELQHGIGKKFTKEQHVDFSRFLSAFIRDKRIELVAEEFSQDAKKVNPCLSTYPEIIAFQEGCGHIFCDPDFNERELLGIKARSQMAKCLGITAWPPSLTEEAEINAAMRPFDTIRENFWFSVLEDRMNQEMLLLIGFYHVPTFKALLDGKQIPNFVVAEQNWS